MIGFLEITAYTKCSGNPWRDRPLCCRYQMIAECAVFNDRIVFYYCLN